jgi:LPS-assembly protein
MNETSRRFSHPLLTLVLGLPALGLPALVWADGCPVPLIVAPTANPDTRVLIDADSVNLEEAGISDLLGKVRIQRGDESLSADRLRFDESTRTVIAEVPTEFRSAQGVVNSQGALFNLPSGEGQFIGTTFELNGSRGSAESLQFKRSGSAELRQGSYTTCPDEARPAWQMRAGRIQLDQNTGLGVAENARLEVLGVPVLYVPWVQFPIDDRRRTGLLAPTFGRNNNNGFDYRQPFYWNINPSYDSVITPRLLSERGFRLDQNFRYLLENHQGQFDYEFLPEDRRTGEKRYFLGLNHSGRLNARADMNLRFGQVSDRFYLEDFGDKPEFSGISYLERSARFRYQNDYRLEALVQNFQPVSSVLTLVDEPYQRLPEVRFDALTRNEWHGFRAGISSEAAHFARPDSVEGQRLHLDPYVRWNKEQGGYYLNGQLDWLYTQYHLNALAADRTPRRNLPQFTLEGGLRLERITDSGDLHRLDPIIQYAYVPHRDQDSLPLFDAGQPDFDFSQLFVRNRLSGVDRISDANQLTVLLQNRIIDPSTGQVGLSASLGQIYRFTDSRVILPGNSVVSAGGTDFLGRVDYRLSQHWTAFGLTQYSADQNLIIRTHTALRYRDERRSVEASYRYRRGLLEQGDIKLTLPLVKGIELSAQTRHSLRDYQNLDSYLGLEYQGCCFRLRATYRRFLSNTRAEYTSGVYFLVQLNGLSRFGTDFATFEDRSLDDG